MWGKVCHGKELSWDWKLSKAEAIIIVAKVGRFSKLPDASLAHTLWSKWFTDFYNIMMVQAFLTISFSHSASEMLMGKCQGDSLSNSTDTDSDIRCLALLLGKKIGTEIPILRAVFMDYLKQPCFPSQRVIYNLNGLTVEWTKYILRHQEKKVNKTEARYSFSIARNSIYFNVLIL